MAEQAGELRRIDWGGQFPFLRIFKTFRQAIQPSKLALAIIGIILTMAVGYLLDMLWSRSAGLPVGPETWAYWQVSDIDSWRQRQMDERFTELQRLYQGELRDLAPEDPVAELNDRRAVRVAQSRIRAKAKAEIAEESHQSAATVARNYAGLYMSLEPYRRRGVFESFITYQRQVVNHFLRAARRVIALDWTALVGGTAEVAHGRHLPDDIRPAGDFSGIGMVGSVILALRGVQWLLAEHPFFAILFLLITLAIWSLLGGAICRMSALTAARDEQISGRSALDFAGRKFFGFLSAPLLPLAMVVIVGLMIFLGSLIFMAIPYFGDIVGPVFLVLALVGGLIMAAVVVGALGGGAMLWPTVAAEGSDGFDAISRSYSYFYSRPWRTAFYALVAAIYGALTYILLRYFVYLLLRLTRYFVSLGTIMTHRPGTAGADATKVEAMWPMPTPDNLVGDSSPLLGLIRWEPAGAAIIHVWLLLVVLLLYAYLVSYFFSAATTIYLLLRQKVDATDFEDVYVEEQDEVVASTFGPPSGEPGSEPPAEGSGSAPSEETGSGSDESSA